MFYDMKFFKGIRQQIPRKYTAYKEKADVNFRYKLVDIEKDINNKLIINYYIFTDWNL